MRLQEQQQQQQSNFKKINKDRKGEQKELYLPATGILRK